MITWGDIPVSAKMAGGIVAAVFAVLAYLSSYQTDAEAQAYQQQHESQLINVRVQQIEQLISQYRYQLLSSNLSPAQREWLLQEIARLEAQKRCVIERKC